MDEPTKIAGAAAVTETKVETVAVEIEEMKATVEVEAIVIRDYREVYPGVAAVACPKCHQKIGIAIDQPYRHVCGAMLVAATKEGS